jgi:hypothetical protein
MMFAYLNTFTIPSILSPPVIDGNATINGTLIMSVYYSHDTY